MEPPKQVQLVREGAAVEPFRKFCRRSRRCREIKEDNISVYLSFWACRPPWSGIYWRIGLSHSPVSSKASHRFDYLGNNETASPDRRRVLSSLHKTGQVVLEEAPRVERRP